MTTDSIRRLVAAVMLVGLAATAGLVVIEQRSARQADTADIARQYAPCNTLACYVEVGRRVADRHGPGVALAAFDGHMANQPAASFSCHDVGHDIGVRTWERTRDLSQASLAQGRACQNAYLHGFLIAWSDDGEDTPEALASVAATCEQAEGFAGRFLCFEAIGHVLQIHSGDDVSAAQRCDIALTRDGREGCVNGVVMQRWLGDFNRVGRHQPFGMRSIVEQVATYCESLGSWVDSAPAGDQFPSGDGTPGSACRIGAVYELSMILQSINDRDRVNPADVRPYVEAYRDLCAVLNRAAADNGRDYRYCVENIGAAFAYTAKGDAALADRLCEVVPTEAKSGCRRWAAVTLVSDWGKDPGVLAPYRVPFDRLTEPTV